MTTDSAWTAARIESFLNDGLFGPETLESEVDAIVSQFITDDYVQYVNDDVLSRTEFLDHALHLKSQLASGHGEVLEFLTDGMTLADRHRVYATKRDGSTVDAEVFLWADIAPDGRLSELREVTRLISGSEDDKDLGSAVRST